MVAIDMRGYGETDRPPNKSDYTADLLIKDIVEIIPLWGTPSAHLSDMMVVELRHGKRHCCSSCNNVTVCD